MAIQMYDKFGNSEIVDNQDVQARSKSGWSFQKPAIVEMGKEAKIKTRPKAKMRITKAEAEVIKPFKEDE
jgi:hypothetical protein